jgi:hypothetical protein
MARFDTPTFHHLELPRQRSSELENEGAGKDEKGYERITANTIIA